MVQMRGADAVYSTLEAMGTELVLGYIGHTTQELADAGNDYPSIRSIHPNTELGGAHIVNGYNFIKGRAAAVGIWHTCGTMLIPGGLYEGLFSRIPSVHLGLNVDGAFKDREAMQEMENVDVLRPVSRYAARVERPNKLPESVARAFQRAHGNPKGPAVLDIPFDLTVDASEMTVPAPWRPEVPRAGASAEAVQEAICLLVGARRPAAIIGGGAVESGAEAEVRELAEALGIPITTTNTAQGILPESHPLALGPTGPIGWRCANEWVASADVVLVVGSRLSDWGWAQSYAADLPAQLIQVDLDTAQLGAFYRPDLSIVGDAKTVLRQILDGLAGFDSFTAAPFAERGWHADAAAARADWIAEMDARAASTSTPISPWRVAGAIQNVIRPDDVVVSDAGNNTGWVFQGIRSEKPHQLVTTFGAGVLGAGFPMALGVALARPEARVIAAVGDGGFGYGTNEIEFALRERIPVTVVVFNDGVLGANNGFMNYLYGKPSWTQLKNPDFVALARAYGADGERVEDPGDLENALRRAEESGTVYVIDVPISREFGYPATGVGGVVRWEPRTWPTDTIGTRSPGKYSRTDAEEPR